MDFSQKLKLLRNQLGLTQEEFANRIGVSRNSVANYETKVREPVAAVFSLICREFNVNEKWLREGVGEMFLSDERISLDEYARVHGITERERSIIEKFLKVDPSKRRYIIEAISNFFDKEQSEKDDIEFKVEAYRQELLAEKKKKEESSLSQTTKEA